MIRTLLGVSRTTKETFKLTETKANRMSLFLVKSCDLFALEVDDDDRAFILDLNIKPIVKDVNMIMMMKGIKLLKNKSIRLMICSKLSSN